MTSFSIHPQALRDRLGNYGRQEIWGELDLNVRLPKGGIVRGASNRISLLSSDGKFHSLQVFYEPDMAFYHASSIEEVHNYWKQYGSVIWETTSSLRVDCGAYILDIDEIGGYVTLSANVDSSALPSNPH